MNPHILIIDGYNFIHRARSGFMKGEFSVVFNFFRNLRAQVELHKPTRVIISLEGHPVHRYEISESYKENRRIDNPSEEQLKEFDDFTRQKNIIIDMLSNHFPVSLMRHPEFEGDDVIYNVIKNSARGIRFTVVSNDGDFTQLLEFPDDVRVYNPMKKIFVEKPPYDYLVWKCLCGDASDNVKGIPGIGKKRAEKLASDTKLWQEFLAGSEEREAIWANNFDILKFFEFSEWQMSQVESSSPSRDGWADSIMARFGAYGFQSLLNEKTFSKFIATFEPLWGET